MEGAVLPTNAIGDEVPSSKDVATPRLPGAKYEETANCMVCGEGDWEEDNVILFCDGCNLAVHQVCYGGGASCIPDGPWYCDRCDPARWSGPAECCLCPEKGGAMKRTTDWRWAHIVCALWVPNVSFVDPESRDAIDLYGMDEKRFGLTCSLCDQRRGACVQCKERKCLRAFHVTCARKSGLHMAEKEHEEWVELAVYCEKHRPKSVGKKRRSKQP